MTIKSRIGAVLAATLLAGGTIAVPTPANAASFTFSKLTHGAMVEVYIYKDGKDAGIVRWYGDPMWGHGGDTLCVSDTGADGWGIEARLSTGRTVSTRGYPAGTDKCKSGDLPEDTKYTMHGLAVRSGYTTQWSPAYTVTS